MRLTLTMRWNYARALWNDDGATPDDLREAVTTLEETARTARRVLGGAHPLTGISSMHSQRLASRPPRPRSRATLSALPWRSTR